jgi:pyruvate dehydrogenase E2 component (dihydrolipoamide acetyltransferase)
MSTGNAVSVEVPDIGDFTDVPIIEILVADGDRVEADDPLLTLESDKATMDVPAPFAGVVRDLQVKVGDKVSQGTPLMVIEAAPTGTTDADAPSEVPDGPAPSAVPDAPARSELPDAPARSEAADAPSGAAEALAPSEAAEALAPSEIPVAPSHPGDGAGDGAIYASPSIRRLARELGVDLHGASGTGRKGRITRADVEQLAGGPRPAPAGGPSAPGLNLAPWPSLDFEKFGPIERVPRSRIQKISAPNLARNWAMIPHVTQHDEADITALEAWRRELNQESAASGVKVTMVSFLVVACVAALKEFPDFNSSLDGDELVLKRYYNIGFAADTPGGLVVPVIKDADRKGLLEIARELGELSATARAGKLTPGDMSGSTFTISSLGGIGGTAFTPIINAPEVAILGVSRSAMKPFWNGDEFVPRLMLPLSLSYDHRVIDGAAAARFVVHLAKLLSDLRRVLL